MKVQDPVAYQIRKETLLQYVRHLFATKGYAETSMDDIAQACKMQKASLYHYFESKEQMLRAMIEVEGARWFASLNTNADRPTFRDTLQAIATTFLKAMDDVAQREFFQILHFESPKNPWIYKAWKESPVQNRDGFYRLFAKHLDGQLPAPKVGMLITQFMGALLHYATVTKMRSENVCGGPFSDADYVEQLVSIFSKGVEALAISDRPVV